MARAPVTRLVVAALAVVALASCSEDPEPVATGGGGIALAETTTEQPRDTEPPKSTTTSTTTTSTTTTTTTTEAPTTTTEPPGPTADDLLGALPGEGWDRREAPTPPADAPSPICPGSDVATPLTGLLYEGAADEGAVAQYERADGSGLVRIVLAPLPDAAARIAEAAEQVPACAEAITAVDWPAQGDGALAFGRGGPAADGSSAQQTFTWVLAHVGTVVAGVEVQGLTVEGQELAPPPTNAEIQAVVQATLDAVAALG